MFPKNTAVTGFPFGLVDKTTGDPITSGTVLGYVTKDSGSQAEIAGTPVHKGNGQWVVDLTANEMNGDVLGLVFTHANTTPLHILVKTRGWDWAQLIQDNCGLALAAIYLHKLMANDTGVPVGSDLSAVIVNGSVLAHLMGYTAPGNTASITTYTAETDSVEAIRNRGDAAWITGDVSAVASVLLSTTVASVTSQLEIVLTAGSDDDDAYDDQVVVFYDASNNDYPSVRKITSYTGSTKTAVISEAPDFTVIAGDGVKVFATAPYMTSLYPDGTPVTYSYSGTYYCARTDVEAIYGADNVEKWADLDNDEDEDKITARILWAIAYASNEINDRLRQRQYELPLSTEAAPTIVPLCAMLAGVILYEARGVQDFDPDSGQPLHRLHWQRKHVMQVLSDIVAGKRRLDITGSAQAASSPFVVKN